jgi:outer membrane cobalamin receptor
MERRMIIRLQLLILIFILSGLSLFAKTEIRGKVKSKGEPIAGASVSIKSSYDGSVSKADGSFRFFTNKKNKVVLSIRYVGYEEQNREIELNDSIMVFEFNLIEKHYRKDAVSVSAGAIETGDEGKSVVLNSLDIVSVAGSGADIVSAMQTLPGSSKVGEQEGLFVRGGEGRETCVYIDGLEVKRPFYSKMPNLTSRGRFNPQYFKGSFFSSGAYSAEFGKGLSSVISLSSIDLPEASSYHIDLMPMGAAVGLTEKMDKSSISGDLSYYNLSPYFKINKQNSDWVTAPKALEGVVNYRIKTSENGIIKASLNFSDNASELNTVDYYNAPQEEKYSLDNVNVYSNIAYKETFGEKWIINSAIAYGYNKDKTRFGVIDSNFTDKQYEARAKATMLFGDYSSINFGGDISSYVYDNNASAASHTLNYAQSSLFLETEIGLGKDFTLRPGIRAEFLSINEYVRISPRFSAAYRLCENNQLSFAMGRYYQSPDIMYLFRDKSLGFEAANHFSLNYQMMSDKQTLRVEAFYKKYDNLTSTLAKLSLDGRAFARGVDLFWRDKLSVPNLDYWISYSYLDSKRKYLYYPIMSEPDYCSKHNLSVVAKKYFKDLNFNLSATYSYASPRRYFNPNNPDFLSDKAKEYHNVSVSAYYLANIFGSFTVFVLSAENIFGIDNVYTYKYSSNGQYKYPIKAASPRAIFFGIYMSFGRDNSEDFN